MNLPCLTLVLPGDTSDYENSSFFVVAPIVYEGRGGLCVISSMDERAGCFASCILTLMCMCVSLSVFYCFFLACTDPEVGTGGPEPP